MMPAGPLLALETSGPLGSVALAVGGQVLARRFLPGRGNQSADLLPAVDAALRDAGVAPSEVEGVAVGAGPGSFTGVRIGAATAKGLVHALGVPLWAFSSLAAAAVAEEALPPSVELPADVVPPSPGTDPAPDEGRPYLRWVLFDARGDRVYGGCWRIAAAGVEVVVPPGAGRVGEVLRGTAQVGTAERIVFVGDGAVRHRERIRGAGFPVVGPPAGVPTADGLLHLLRSGPGTPPVADPRRWEPDYVKASNAERASMG